MDNFKYLTGVSTLAFDVDTCVGCGICTMVCPHGIFTLSDSKAQVVDKDDCMECGACAANCPTQAVSVSPAASVVPLTSSKRGLKAKKKPVAVMSVVAENFDQNRIIHFCGFRNR